MKDKAVVLLSSGLDSTVNLYAAKNKWNVVLALTFNYGQKAAQKELAAAKSLADEVKVPHQVLEITWFKNFHRSSLLVDSEEIPTGDQVDIQSLEQSEKTAKSVWVPNRNGIFLNIAAAFAESLGAKFVVPGFNAEEATTFPDNSQAFLDQTTKAFSFSSANQVEAVCLTTALDKSAIVAQGKLLKVPFEKMWPCYQSLEKWCGRCESCQRSKRAMLNNQLPIENWFLQV